jgi:hypothetical protein
MGIDVQNSSLFFEQVTNKIDGWLDPFTAARTMDLLDFQDQACVSGAFYEVGIYKGKYLSILLRSALLSRSKLVGIDCFNAVPRSSFEEGFYQVTEKDALSERYKYDFFIMEGFSAVWSAKDIMDRLGSEARFISVDGSHDFPDVLWDLSVAEKVMAPGGIISADDFFNPNCLGTNQAINHFLANTDHVVPFAYIAGKLFICRPAFAKRYRDEVERGTMADRESPKAQAFRNQVEGGFRYAAETIFHGERTLQIP